MMMWIQKHPQAHLGMLGLIPNFLDDSDPRSAKEQLHTAYQTGGGWHPFKGFTMLPDGSLAYPGDPETRLLYETKLREETIRVYEHSWVAIVQPDNTFEVARMD